MPSLKYSNNMSCTRSWKLVRKNSMICRLRLIQLLSTVCSVPSPRRGFGGLSPPNKAPSPQIGTWNSIVYQWSFCQFLG